MMSGDDIDLWVPKLVRARLIEAVKIAQYTTGRTGPRGYGSGLPNELIAALGKPEGDGESSWWEMPGPEHAPPKRSFGAKKISRMEEAISWTGRYLNGQDGMRRVLCLFLWCKVYRRSFEQEAKKRKWSCSTAYWRLDQALGRIAQGLNADRVPVEV